MTPGLRRIALRRRGESSGSDASSAAGPLATYREIGLSLLGISRTTAWEMFENFMAMPSGTAPPASWLAFSSSGTGAVSNQNLGTQAVSRLTTGATSGSSRDQMTTMYMGHQGTTPWYLATSFAVNAAPDSQARMLQTITTPGGNTVGVGVLGAISATHFVAFRDGTFSGGTSIGSLGAFDTAQNLYELWCPGDGSLNARFNGGSIFSAAQASAAADMYHYHTVRNGTTAAARIMDRRFVYWLVRVT